MSVEPELIQRLHKENIRIAHIQFIPLCFSDGTVNEIINDIININEEPEELERFFPGIQEYIEDGEGACYFGDKKEYLNPPYLVHFETPVRRNVDENGYDYSWGCHHTFWIRGETLEDCCKQAIKWLDDKYSTGNLFNERSSTHA